VNFPDFSEGDLEGELGTAQNATNLIKMGQASSRHFWTGGAARFEKKEKMSYNLTMKKKELTQILQERECHVKQDIGK